VQWALRAFPQQQVLYVLGNHEYYRHATPKLLTDIKQATAGTNLHVLENDAVVIDGVEFLGCTLWADFRLFGGDPRLAGSEAQQVMNDYRVIRVSPAFRRLRAADSAAMHAQSVNWLRQRRAAPARRRVVITHHAPSKRSLPPEKSDDIVRAAYASNLDELVRDSGASLWVHGHIHTYQDYMIGVTRVLCNPRGYPDKRTAGFQANLVLEL
jgi:predicted phosphohydrolase